MLGIVLSTQYYHNTKQQPGYKDCWEVKNDGQSSGVYQLRLYNRTTYTYCKDGMTLIQKTNPDVGNRKYYFDRGFQYYEKGFGFSAFEFFIGLENMYLLNQMMGNHVLRLELTMAGTGIQFWIEFDNFQIKQNFFDTTYYYGTGETRNKNDTFPITSLGRMTSSLKMNGQFVFIRPNYFGTHEHKWRDRGEYR